MRLGEMLCELESAVAEERQARSRRESLESVIRSSIQKMGEGFEIGDQVRIGDMLVQNNSYGLSLQIVRSLDEHKDFDCVELQPEMV